ncbi:MAG TPA: hypothetical protein VIH99_08980 [Bdellovibrionota bacterium]
MSTSVPISTGRESVLGRYTLIFSLVTVPELFLIRTVLTFAMALDPA